MTEGDVTTDLGEGEERQNGKHQKAEETPNGTGEDITSWDSLSGSGGEWETRKISVMGVVKRFISQLSYGQDLTRICFPSEFLNPFSILELVGDRFLSRFSCLITANKQAEPAFRMLHVAQYFLSALHQTKLYKKPYNPVVGESHYCFTEHPGSKTRFVAEQVTHHPPVSAMHAENEEEGIKVTGIVSFGVKFHMNSVTIGTSGDIRIKLDKHNEEYIFTKSIPDLLMKNVVFGTRQMKWQKNVEIECKSTNTKCVITFVDSGSSETLTGVITQDGSTTLKFEGTLDDEIYWYKPEADEETLLVSEDAFPKNKIIYPPNTDAFPTIKVWREVTKAIIANDMTEADKSKQAVEEEQRVRVRAGEDDKKERKYFIFNDERNSWIYKDGSLVIPS
eukprot:TRINITY_DN2628_c0_g1_i1.p1 TRINITY_DN2628_c0_g1~~TRINITY_DN2628_c0_g1_i1.p1  ORF type:complete len:392 (+),score=100.05 TRINITY_DN2628_c0_g1_i1:54-1229(+)